MPVLDPASPIPFSPDLEDLSLDKPETIEGLNGAFHQVQQKVVEDHGHALRAVHAKSLGVIVGEIRIDEGLPPELAQGLFATPGQHRVAMRFSTNAGDNLPDSIGLPRGLAIKVLDVDGERIEGAEGRTQDFIFVNGPTFQVKTLDKFLGNLKLLAKTTDRVEGLKVAFSATVRGVELTMESVGAESAALKAMGGAPNVHPLGETYFSASPFRYGEFVAKFQVAPVSPDLTRFTGQIIDTAGRRDAIREDLASDMVGTDAVWELRVQLLRDLEQQPVEDSTTEWPEEVSPFLRVATIHATPQNSWDAELVRRIDEGLRFSVWTGLAAHRPLGSINRGRRSSYNKAAAYRGEVNRCPLNEPTGGQLDG